ncbi:MAG: glycosyltransferase [Gammaproteobacteria bacterium]|nr:glycosyltransferase [Gammaproteobacteria bacterium]
MRVAFVIFKFFPHGGSARDLVKIVSRCRARGHQARIYALEWEGPRVDGVEVVVLAQRGVRSHVRQRRFAERVADHVAGHPVDLVVGMNKMPGLDVYYAADSCFEDKARTQRPWPYRLTSRYRHYGAFERAVFARESRTRILTIAPDQDAVFRTVYGTPAHRFRSLPPGIERDRNAATAEAGRALRTEFGVAGTDILLLFVGSGFVKKGLDRLLVGVAALPAAIRKRVRLFVVGDDKAARFQRLARRLGVARRVRFVGGRDDVAAWLQGADAFALPAYDEAAGMVILEAAIAGVPVLTTANCGYATILRESDAGIVTPAPFEQGRFNADLERLLTADERAHWSHRGRQLAADESLYAMAPRAVELLEAAASGREPPVVSFCALEYSKTDPRYRALVPVAQACRRRGMNVQVFVGDWRGSPPQGLDVVVVPATAVGRHKRWLRRREWLATWLRWTPMGTRVGFEVIPGMDLRYIAAPLEASDANDAGPASLFAPTEGKAGLEHAPMPPGRNRKAVRAEFDFDQQAIVFAMVGGDLAGRGFERLIMGLGRLPEALRGRCAVLGAGRLDVRFGNAGRVFGLGRRIRVDIDLSPLDAIEAADAFVDLSYRPTCNGWVFDALAAGRPVVTCAAVHESGLVSDADAGIVLDSAFRQGDLNKALASFVESVAQRSRWSANAVMFAADPDRFGQADRVAAAIEQHARGRGVHAESLPA